MPVWLTSADRSDMAGGDIHTGRFEVTLLPVNPSVSTYKPGCDRDEKNNTATPAPNQFAIHPFISTVALE
jgi:hypothetical protein